MSSDVARSIIQKVAHIHHSKPSEAPYSQQRYARLFFNTSDTLETEMLTDNEMSFHQVAFKLANSSLKKLVLPCDR